jgi:protein TonB
MNHFKKTNKKLEKLRGIFFQLGLIIAGGLTLLAFEWTSTIKISELPGITTIDVEGMEELPPIIYTKDPEKPKVKHSNTTSNVIKPVEKITEPLPDPEPEPNPDPDPPFDPTKWATPPEPDPEPAPLYIAGRMPHYNDCKDLEEEKRKKCTQEKMYEHFGEKIKVPEIIKMKGKAKYKAHVYFEVSKSGEIVNVKMLEDKNNKIPRELEREAFNAVKSLPKMIPGKNHGKRVSVRYSVPIVFTIN